MPGQWIIRSDLNCFWGGFILFVVRDDPIGQHASLVSTRPSGIRVEAAGFGWHRPASN